MNWQQAMVLAGVVLTGTKGAQAAEFDPQGAEASYFDDLPTVVSAGRMEQPLTRAPASVTVIDREMIEASGRTSLPDLMRLAAGFQVGHQGGFWVGVTRHGVSEEFARRMQVLVDGRTVYLPGTAGVDWHDLPLALEDIDRIEVTRGPNGASYGANAYLGTIHIHTRTPGEQPGTRVRVEGGEQAYRRTLVSHDSRGERIDQRLSWQYQEDDGYRGGADEARHDQQRHKLNYRGRLRPGVNDHVDVMAGMTAGEWGYGEGTLFRPAREAEVERYYGQLAWQRLFSTREELRARLHLERADTDLVANLPALTEDEPLLGDFRDDRGDSDAPLRLDESRDIRRMEAEVEYHHQPIEALRLIWGGQSRRDTMAAPGYFGDDETRSLHHNRLFGHAEWRPGTAWTVHAGTGVEYEDYTGTNLAPRAALNWHYHEEHAVRLAATRAWRTPGFVDSEADWGHRFTDNNEALHYIARGNDALDPERIDSVELAAVGQTPTLNYEVKLFRQRLVDLVTGVMTHYDETEAGDTPYYDTFCDPELNPVLCREAGRLIRLENDGTLTQQGLEVQLDWQPTERTRIGLGYAYVEGDGELTERVEGDGSVERWDADDLAPDHTFSFLLSQRWGAWRAGFAAYHVNEMDWISADDPVSFTTADLSVARDIPMARGSGEIKLAVLDGLETYSSFREDYEHERRIYLRLGLNL